jgi:phosphoglycerate dehydrogenase-like enzyme
MCLSLFATSDTDDRSSTTAGVINVVTGAPSSQIRHKLMLSAFGRTMELAMGVGVLGTGMVGRAIAERLAELGHDVVVGTRDMASTMVRNRT